MTKQRLRTEMQNTEKKRLLSNVEIGKTAGAGRADDDVEVLNEESDEVDGDLELAIQDEQNYIHRFVYQQKNMLMFVGEEKKLGY